MMVLTPDVGDIADVPDPLHGLAMSSWLIEGFTVYGQWQGVGCFVCRDRLSSAVEGGAGAQAARRFAECRVKTAKAMQICNILRHGELQCHQDCARRALGLLVAVDACKSAPPSDHFLQVLDMISSGRAPSAGLKGVGDKKNPEDGGVLEGGDVRS